MSNFKKVFGIIFIIFIVFIVLLCLMIWKKKTEINKLNNIVKNYRIHIVQEETKRLLQMIKTGVVYDCDDLTRSFRTCVYIKQKEIEKKSQEEFDKQIKWKKTK